MSVNKIVTKVDGVINKTINFNDLKAGLAAGSHTITVEAFNGATLISSQTKNITIAAVASYDSDYQAVLDYATANSIALPTTTQQDLDNQFIIDYKASGGWDLDDVVFRFKSTAPPAFKLICWKRRIQAVAYGGLTWSDSGVLGNGTNGYIDPLFIPSTDAVNFTLEDASIGFSTFSESTTGSSFIAGAYDGTLTSYIILSTNNGSSSYAVMNGDVQTSPAYSKLGYTSVNRISDKIWIDNTTEFVRNIGQVIGIKLFILGRNNQGVADLFDDTGTGFFSFGASKKTIHSSIAPLF